jgi:GTPase involved in cell partitioning and DNA repair
MLNSKRNFLKDIERIRSLSSIIDKKLSDVKSSDADKIDKLTLDELQDLDKIVGIADFMLCKYADKKEMRSILEYFTSIITDTANSMDNLDDEISELILSAEDSINKVKDLHARIDNESDFKKNYCDGPDYNRDETGGINLTNFVTEVNTVGYQQNSSGHNTR